MQTMKEIVESSSEVGKEALQEYMMTFMPVLLKSFRMPQKFHKKRWINNLVAVESLLEKQHCRMV
jgi:hypothetical protein